MTAWLQNVVTANVKPTTMQGYVSFLNNHVAPHLGNVKIQDLTPAMIDEWMRKLLQGGLAKNTLSAIHALIHAAQLIPSNPVAYIKVPKKAPRNVIERKIITPEQFSALLEKYPFGSSFHMPLMLLYHTGMRPLSLMWRDIISRQRQSPYNSKWFILFGKAISWRRSKLNQVTAS